MCLFHHQWCFCEGDVLACFHLRKCCSTSFWDCVWVNGADFGEFDFILCCTSVPMMPLTLGSCFCWEAGTDLARKRSRMMFHAVMFTFSLFFLDWCEVESSGGQAPGGETEDAAETRCGYRKSENQNSSVEIHHSRIYSFSLCVCICHLQSQ